MSRFAPSSDLFRGRTLAILIIAGVLSFFAAIYLSAKEVGIETELTSSANTFSSSAIGHKAFVELMRDFGVPVVVSRYDTGFKVGSRSLVILAEPTRRISEQSDSHELLDKDNVLLVLPKWEGTPKPFKVRWLGNAEPENSKTVARILDQVLPGAKIIRGSAQNWTINTVGPDPEIKGLQLFSHPGVEPMVATPDGILLGRVKDNRRNVYVLADPDVLSNHGIGKGKNAQFSLAMIEGMRTFGASVVIDEIIHGFKQSPDLLRTLFAKPFLGVSLIIMLAISLLIWAAFGRHAPAEALPPSLAPGKMGLIENTGDLLLYGGHGGALLLRYLDDARRLVATRLNAPRGLDGNALQNWIVNVEANRNVTETFWQISTDTAALTDGKPGGDKLATLANRIYRWRQEMLDGA